MTSPPVANAQSSEGSPPWDPEEHVDYEKCLGAASNACLDTLRQSTSADRRRFVLDPRSEHRQLFCALAPADHPEYAGTYRGTLGTSLEGRTVALVSHTGRSPQQVQAPFKVLGDIEGFYASLVNEYFEKAAAIPGDEAIQLAGQLFYAFGRIQPFLNGNGHIQRLIFAACLYERTDMSLLPSWTVHPRPYGVEFAEAVEGWSPSQSKTLVTRLLSSYVETSI